MIEQLCGGYRYRRLIVNGGEENEKWGEKKYWVKLLNRDVAVKWAREEIEGKWKEWVEMGKPHREGEFGH